MSNERRPISHRRVGHNEFILIPVNDPINITLMLANTLHERKVRGIRIREDIHNSDNRARVIFSRDAIKVFQAIESTPEMRLLAQVTNPLLHTNTTADELQFKNVEGVFNKTDQERLKVLYWKIEADRLLHLSSLVNISPIQRDNYIQRARQALAHRDSLIYPRRMINSPKYSLITNQEIRSWVEAIADAKLSKKA